MKQLFILLTALLLTNGSYAQITFEKGYFITNAGEKTDCLIKNADWKNNPTKFKYKLSETSNELTASIADVTEFGINNVSKYIRSTVHIDRSSEALNELTIDKNPVFQEEELFLKVLIEGKGTLYYYGARNLVRFFYRVDQGEIKQLVYKSYRTTSNQVGQNLQFRQQLWTDLTCSEITSNTIERISYNKRNLTSFFVSYNACHNQEVVNFDTKSAYKALNLNLRAGINRTDLEVDALAPNSTRSSAALHEDFDISYNLRVGLEAEFILPFHKNKWAIIIEPTFQSFKSEAGFEDITWSSNFTSIAIPIGARHYFFLNDQSKLFVNGAYVFDFATKNADITANNGRYASKVSTIDYIAAGIGYKHKDKLSIELRYLQDREMLTDGSILWKGVYGTTALVFGYTIY